MHQAPLSALTQFKTIAPQKTAFSYPCHKNIDDLINGAYLVKLDPDFSSIELDHVIYPIDAILMQGTTTNEEREHHINHIRWSVDGQALLMTTLSYVSQGNLARQELTSMVGHTQLSMANEQLVIHYKSSLFNDSVLEDSIKIHCTYKNKDKK